MTTPTSHEWERRLPDILGLLASGKTMQQTADRLHLTLGAVKRYLTQAFRAYDVPNRNALIHVACSEGLLAHGLPRVAAARRDLELQETRVLRRLAAGDTYAEAGAHMCLSRHTITTYTKRALYARGAATAAQLVYLAHEDGLLGGEDSNG